MWSPSTPQKCGVVRPSFRMMTIILSRLSIVFNHHKSHENVDPKYAPKTWCIARENVVVVNICLKTCMNSCRCTTIRLIYLELRNVVAVGPPPMYTFTTLMRRSLITCRGANNHEMIRIKLCHRTEASICRIDSSVRNAFECGLRMLLVKLFNSGTNSRSFLFSSPSYCMARLALGLKFV